MSRNGIVTSNGDFDWDDALIDASIAAGVTFFTTLGGLGIAGLLDNPTKALIAAGIAAGGSFFGWLAMKRNVGEKK